MKKVLIVDDSGPSRISLSFSIKQKGHTVFTAEDGQEGLVQIMANPDIALVITDINMPKMNGFQLINNIRNNPETENLPIIALSVDEDKGNEAISKGATAFVIKSSKSSEEIKRFLDIFLR